MRSKLDCIENSIVLNIPSMNTLIYIHTYIEVRTGFKQAFYYINFEQLFHGFPIVSKALTFLEKVLWISYVKYGLVEAGRNIFLKNPLF